MNKLAILAGAGILGIGALYALRARSEDVNADPNTPSIFTTLPGVAAYTSPTIPSDYGSGGAPVYNIDFGEVYFPSLPETGLLGGDILTDSSKKSTKPIRNMTLTGLGFTPDQQETFYKKTSSKQAALITDYIAPRQPKLATGLVNIQTTDKQPYQSANVTKKETTTHGPLVMKMGWM